MTTNLKEGDIVLCTVTKIVGATVFVEIEGNGEGSIITSEITSGRIRNLRDYVVPNKKIVCKVLRVKGNHIDLSLRRVTAREREEVLERYKRERSCLNLIKNIVGDNSKEICEKITKEQSLSDFFQRAKENPDILNRFFDKECSEKLLKFLKQKKEREKFVKKNFELRSEDAEGIIKIKNALKDFQENVTYLSAGNYVLKVKGEDFKQANLFLKDILENIKEKAEKFNLEFSVKSK